jgi:hypothetical protein
MTPELNTLLRVVEVTPDLDLEYIDRWVRDLDVVDLWRSFEPGRRS